MLLVNKQRDDKLNETSGGVIDAEAERHEAETRGMMDQTEVRTTGLHASRCNN